MTSKEGSGDVFQGYSGSALRLVDGRVEKVSSCAAFVEDRSRQTALQQLSNRTRLLPSIVSVEGATMRMDFIRGSEGLTEHNAAQVGAALRSLHELRGFPYPAITGVDWLISLANDSLAQAKSPFRVSEDLQEHYPPDALILCEPQFLQTEAGQIVFIDLDEMGQGSRYQDLGFVAYLTMVNQTPELLDLFLSGYQSSSLELNAWRIRQMAGLISLAYASFADTGKRLALGLQLMHDAARHLGQVGLHRVAERA
ncbi:MAG: hypothetical protein ACE149_05260 [Armatimonadota bacterium]